MRVNYKQMYLLLLQERRSLLNKLEGKPRLPEGFNQTGWDDTIEAVETLLAKLKELRELKGKRLTPRFFQGIYSQCINKIRDADRLLERWKVDIEDIDFEAECTRLTAENQQLRAKLEAASAGQADQE